MTGNRAVTDILRVLSETPFLHRGELASFSWWSESGIYKAVDRLQQAGLIASVPHATETQNHMERYYLTAAGLREVASYTDGGLDETLRARPVSAQWQRLLLERLDSLAAVYSVAEAISAVSTPLSIRLYRAAPIDAAVTLPDGRAIGIVRLGRMSDRTSFAKRMQRLNEGPLPGAVVLLVPDDIRLRHARRSLSRPRVPTFIALESDAVSTDADEPIWHMPGTTARLDMESVVRRVVRGGRLAVEPPLATATLPDTLPADRPLSHIPTHLLPSALHPADKRVLDLLSDWPGIKTETLRELLDLSASRFSQIGTRLKEARLIHVFRMDGNRLALTDHALGLLARRDRAAVGVARQRWSMGDIGPGTSIDWRDIPGRQIRQLLRHIDHTDAVHTYLAFTFASARMQGWDVVQLDPPHRASRYFWHDGGQRSVHPDAFFMLRRGDETQAYFLEWERRAVRPSTMRDRLAPYLRYYSTKRPLDDHGVTPTVLIVVEDEITAGNFRQIAAQEMERKGVAVPLRVASSLRGMACASSLRAMMPPLPFSRIKVDSERR